ncbi:MAG: DNA topoisomerase I [Methanobacteriota archaeon]|nr:MAG: DNA topoisomerase I [Euryarchaeota archaeon]
MRKLIVTEKLNTAVRISSILSAGKMKRAKVGRVPTFSFTKDGHDYTVVGMRGHILNLDYADEFNDWTAVDLKRLVWVEPVKRVTEPAFADALKELALGVDEVIVATDFDREGELIGKEALEVIREVNPNVAVRRARYSSLTRAEIEESFANLAEFDLPLAESAESRQVVDLAWGAALTRFVSIAAKRLGKDFLSVGRVQSPTLALIVNREREIENFVPQDFWSVTATFEKAGTRFPAAHEKGRFWVQSEAEAARTRALGAKAGTVAEYTRNEREEWPPAPFSTTTFLAEANRLGYGAAQAMRIAESLYQSGWLSYPRTDNTVYPPTLSLKGVLNRLEESELAAEARELLAQEKIRARRGPVETTDHPPIYPTGGAKKSDIKRQDHWRIYELVTRRFLATVAPACIVDVSEAKLDAGGEKFAADGYVVKDPGWRKYYPYWTVRESSMPALEVGEKVPLVDVGIQKDSTQPVSRYSQGNLIQEMERLGLGTKSTRHEIIQKLYDRDYVEGKVLRPTGSGKALIGALEDHAEKITQPEMTAHLEQDMDEIARGVRQKAEVVQESQRMLEEVVEVLQKNEAAIGQEIESALKEQNYIGPCNACKKGTLLVRRSRTGRRFLGCDRYPECTNTHPLPQMGIIVSGAQPCPECGSPMIKQIDRGREETFCVDSECPTVRDKTLIAACDKCAEGELRIIHSARGKRFVGCSNYPTCTNSFPLPQRGFIQRTENRCEACGHPIVNVLMTGRKPWVICINMECPTKVDKQRKKAAAERKKAAAERKKAAAAGEKAPKKARAPRKPKAKPVPVAEATVAPTP